MIAFVSGMLDSVEENAAVVNVGGMGCRVFMTGAGLSALPPRGETVKLYTYLRLGEDIMDLYGFVSKEELSMFKLMLSVSGVGPKAALAILSALAPHELALAVVTEDYKTIARAQGVGPKLAQRISLELRDKLKNDALLPAGNAGAARVASPSAGNDALEALMVLGYSQFEAASALAGVEKDLSVEDTIKAALARLMKA